MRMDMPDLRLFLAVVEAGSITAGAARVHLSLAAASERLRAMEGDSRVALLRRHARGVSATDAGEALAHHARLILRQQSLLQGELHDFASGARGTVHLYANTGALVGFLPTRLAPWLAQRPRVQVELRERTSVEIVRAVRGGQAEAGIISNAVAAEGLHVQPVDDDPLLLVVPPGHALAGQRSVAFTAILGETFVALADGNALHEHIQDNARQLGGELRVRIRMKNFEGICTMVSHGIGLGIVPRSTAHRLRRTLGFQVVALEDPWARRRLSLCFAAWHALPRPMQSLLLHLGAQVPD